MKVRTDCCKRVSLVQCWHLLASLMTSLALAEAADAQKCRAHKKKSSEGGGQEAARTAGRSWWSWWSLRVCLRGSSGSRLGCTGCQRWGTASGFLGNHRSWIRRRRHREGGERTSGKMFRRDEMKKNSKQNPGRHGGRGVCERVQLRTFVVFRRFLSVSTVSSLIKTKLYTAYNVTITDILEKGYFLYFVPLLFQFYFIYILNLILLYHVFLIYLCTFSFQPFLIISIVRFSYFFFIADYILYYFAFQLNLLIDDHFHRFLKTHHGCLWLQPIAFRFGLLLSLYINTMWAKNSLWILLVAMILEILIHISVWPDKMWIGETD